MFAIKEILECTGGKLVKGSSGGKVSGVSIDSRTIKPNELFVAIKGERFDGHVFIKEALTRGAAAIVFSGKRYEKTALKHPGAVPMLRVRNTVWALGALAYSYRARFKIPVIAVTGSNGKTTTKEMLKAILSKRFSVLCNPGTQNNHIGVPLAIFKLQKKHRLAVIEIGASRAGEIDRLSWIIQPNVGVITNIGPSHLKSFKNLQGVFKTKIELTKNLSRDAKLVINQDDRFLSGLNGPNLCRVTFGLNRSCDFYAEGIKQTEKETSFVLNGKHHITLKVLGRHNVYNALASIAVAKSFGIGYNEIKDALSIFKAPPMRMQLFDINNVRIISDCYNSNPDSLTFALEFLSEYSSRGKKIAVCGDMLELGERARSLHFDIGKKLAGRKIDFLITVGPLSKDIAFGAHAGGMSKESIRTYSSASEAANALYELAEVSDIVLIKGSRAMQMENIIKCFTGSSTR